MVRCRLTSAGWRTSVVEEEERLVAASNRPGILMGPPKRMPKLSNFSAARGAFLVGSGGRSRLLNQVLALSQSRRKYS
jgi:hypothetical protein